MFSHEDIIACAKDIQPALPSLLGDDAPAIAQELSALLIQCSAGQDVDIAILQTLSKNEPSRAWTMRYLTGTPNGDTLETVRSIQLPPPGETSPIPGTPGRYFCRVCGYSQSWIRREAGQQPPSCPNDSAVILQLSRIYAQDSND